MTPPRTRPPEPTPALETGCAGETRLLLRRTRAGLWVILGCIALFALGDLDVSPTVLRPLYALKLGHVLLVLILMRVVRRVTTWRGAVATALVTVNATFCAIATTDVWAGHLDTMPLLGVVCSMAVATLLPWGMWPQAITVMVAEVGTLWALGRTGKPLAELADPVTAVSGALLVSVYVAYEFGCYRKERARAEDALAQRARLEALRADVRAAATEKGSLEQALHASAEAIVRHLGAAFARIWTLDPTGRVLELQASAGMYTHRDGAHARVPVGQFKIGLIAAERRAHLTNAVQTDPRVGDREWARREGMVAFAGYPLLVEDRLLGVVALFARHPLDATTLEALESVAHAVAVSIERARAEESLARSQAQLEEEAAVSAALAHVAEGMFSSLDAPVMLEQLCRLTSEVLGCDYSTTLLWRPEDDVYTPVACEGLAPKACHAVLGRRVARETMAAVFSGASGEDVAEYRAPRAPGLRVCIALRRGKDLIGVQDAYWSDEREQLTPRRRRIARGVARLAAMALANARLVEELERVSRLKSEFVSTMSHELRTPLNVILGYAEMARDPGVGSERDTCLERIESAGRELLELIEGTLQIGRIEAGRAEAELEPVRLAPLFAELGRACAALPRSQAVALEWEEAVPDATLVTDPRKLAIVVRNLVGNACKFTERGRVRVEVRRVADALVLRVSDTGIGIRPEDQETIFEMFRQADGSDSRRFGGTGLGLYIVRRFVQGLGGTVGLDSAPGRGSTFTITLPWRETAAPVVSAA